MTRVLNVCPEKDLEAITAKQTVSYGSAFRAKIGVVQAGLKMIGFSDKFGLAEIGRLCPPERSDKLDKPDRADLQWVRSIFTRLINYYEYLEAFKGTIAPTISKVVGLSMTLGPVRGPTH